MLLESTSLNVDLISFLLLLFKSTADIHICLLSIGTDAQTGNFFGSADGLKLNIVSYGKRSLFKRFSEYFQLIAKF